MKILRGYRQIADYLGIPKSTLHLWCQQGHFKFPRTQGNKGVIFVTPELLMADIIARYMDANGITSAKESGKNEENGRSQKN